MTTNIDQLPFSIRDAIRLTAQAVAEETIRRLGTVLPIARTWLCDREVESLLGWKAGTLATKRNRGELVPPSFGVGKQRRTRASEIDAFVIARGDSG